MPPNEKGPPLSQGSGPAHSAFDAGGNQTQGKDSRNSDAFQRRGFPYGAGSKDIESNVSRENAAAHDAAGKTKGLQDRAEALLVRFGPMTADEIAARMEHPYANVRPRLGELASQGRVYALQSLGRGANGGRALVWAVSPPDQVQAMAASRKAKWTQREARRCARLLTSFGLDVPAEVQAHV